MCSAGLFRPAQESRWLTQHSAATSAKDLQSNLTHLHPDLSSVFDESFRILLEHSHLLTQGNKKEKAQMFHLS